MRWVSVALVLGLTVSTALAGGPLNVRPSDGAPYRWSTASPILYWTDGGNLGLWSNATALANVQQAFNRWGPDLPTSTLTFSRAGGIPGDGNVNTVAEFNALDGVCDGISAVIFDADGSLFAALGLSNVIGFAGPDCGNSATATLTEATAAFNGKYFDGNLANGELTEAEFNGLLVHEFGHWLNLDHSQTNGHYFLGDTDPGFTAFGPPALSSVEIMFPFAIGGATTPRKDDIAAISRLYPAAGFSTSTGAITGTIRYPNGITPFQGADVIARNVADPYNDAVSDVSGAPLATPSSVGAFELPGLTAGASYSVEMVNVRSDFTGGSSVGPVDPPAVIPAAEEFYNGVNEASSNPPDNVAIYTSVASTAGVVTSGVDIIMNGAQADLLLSQTDFPDPATVGQNVTYTLTVTNGGPSTATNVTVTDTLPVGVTFVSATASFGSCSQASGTVTCGVGTIAVGATRTVTIVVTPTSVGTITNTATVVATEGDPTAANNSASATTTVNPASADLSVTMTDAPDPVVAGGSVAYTATVTNNGPNQAASVTLSGSVPGGSAFVSATSSSGTCSQSAGVVTCSIGSMASGASVTVTITVMANSAGTLTNTVSVSSAANDPNTGNNSASAVTTVTPGADLSVGQSDVPDPVAVGGGVTYTITVTNNGPDATSGVTLTDTMPTPTTFNSATPSQGSCTTPSGGTFTCSLGSLASGASATVTLVVTTSTAGMIGNTVSVAALESDPNPANNTSVGGTNVGDMSRLINLSTRGPVLTAPSVIYGGFILRGDTPKKLLIRGRGPSLSGAPFLVPGTLANPKIDLYSGTTIIAQNDNWQTQTTGTLCLSPAVACGSAADITATGADPCKPNPGQTVAPPGCTNEAALLVTLPPGPYSVVMSGVNNTTGIGLFGVTDLDTGTAPKLVNISTRGVVQASPNLMHGGFIIGAGTGSKTVVIRGRGPSLSGAPFLVPGTLANPKIDLYSGTTIIARNDNWQITDPLCLSPAAACGNATQVTATGLDPCVPNPGQTVAPPGCANEAAILVTLPPGPYTVVMSGVGVATGVALIGITEVSTDLAITKADSPDPVTVGNPLTYTLTVTNNSTYPATGVTVLDTLPAGVTLVSAITSDAGSCTYGSTVTCSLGTVTNGAPETVTIVVIPTVAGTISNTASVTGTLTDPDITNNMTPPVLTTVNP